MRVGQTVTVGDHEIVVPGIYEEFKTVPGDPPRALSVGTRTEMGTALVIASPIGMGDLMPFDGAETIVAALRGAIDDRQGIVEARTGETAAQGLPFALFILKAATDEPGGLQYILSMDVLFGVNDAIHIQGYFDEGPTTGIRASMVMASLLRAGEVSIDHSDSETTIRGWARDPYDASVRHGFLANRAEDRTYDAMFPLHPLSLARSLAESVISSL